MSPAPTTLRSSSLKTLVVLSGLVVSCLCCSLGCRSGTDNQIDLLERELRTQENYIYELEDYVLEYSEKLRQARCVQPYTIETRSKPNEPELAPKRIPQGTAEERSAAEPSDELPEPPQELPEADSAEPISPEDLEIPELEIDDPEPLGQLEEESTEHLAREAFETGDEVVYSPDGSVELVSAAEEPTNEQYSSEAEFLEQLFEEESSNSPPRLAQRLVITNVLRSDSSDAPPTSLMTVIEARDNNDEPVDLDGKVSLMIMTADPESPQRLKRWDFSADETASAWQTSPLGDGLHLELPLGEFEAPAEPAELWVRLVDTDGRKLLSQLPLEWEQLLSVEGAMQRQSSVTDNEEQVAEDDARPLVRQHTETAQLAEVMPSRIAKREQKPRNSAPKWRASMQRSHAIDEGFATTSTASRSWTPQPTSGREAPATHSQFSSTVQQASSSAKKGSGSEPSVGNGKPRWSPPSASSTRR